LKKEQEVKVIKQTEQVIKKPEPEIVKPKEKTKVRVKKIVPTTNPVLKAMNYAVSEEEEIEKWVSKLFIIFWLTKTDAKL